MFYKIRPCKQNDLDQLIDLCADHADFEKAFYSKEGKKVKLENSMFKEHPEIYCLVVEQANQLIGYATYSFEFSTWDADFYTHMDCLYLKPEARNYGIGEQLIKEISKSSIQKNISLIQWQTPAFNERAIKFYNRIGASSKEKLRFYLDEEGMRNLLQ